MRYPQDLEQPREEFEEKTSSSSCRRSMASPTILE